MNGLFICDQFKKGNWDQGLLLCLTSVCMLTADNINIVKYISIVFVV